MLYYCYDTETGLYYLNTRYFSPKCSRFISPNNLNNVVNYRAEINLYAYCQNDSINKLDSKVFFLKLQ